jgi:peptide/nickel transport system ATP-binding protein
LTQPLLEITGLSKHFPVKSGILRRVTGYVKAVSDVSLAIKKGETLGLVGESGCGKTTIGRLILRVIEPTSGTMRFCDEGETVNLEAIEGNALRTFRKNMQLIFQDPFASLNPRMTVHNIIAEPLVAHRFGSKKEIDARVRWLTEAVGLRVEFLRRYPHAFSGGQRQRICIARALALNPKLIVCDEPVSALDVSVQAQIINLLKDLQTEHGFTYLFIAHDLSVVENISTEVAVMYAGKIVERAGTSEIFNDPRHPYTEALLKAVCKPDPSATSTDYDLPGEVADPANLPSGCAFHPRCRYAKDVCRNESPVLTEVKERHVTACHLASELDLQGV